MVIEFLTFEIDPGELDEWLAVDERTWTAFLARQDGFVSKQIWTGRDTPGVVHAVITWRDEAAWKSIAPADLAAVDASMGTWLRAPTCRTFDVVDVAESRTHRVVPGMTDDRSAEKPTDEWVTGDEPMTGPQASYLQTLAREANETVPDDLTKAQASELIDRLQRTTGRGQEPPADGAGDAAGPTEFGSTGEG